MQIDPIHELESSPELFEAARAAQERVRWGGWVPLDPETFEWPSGPGPDTTPCFARIRTGPNAGDSCMNYAGAGTDHKGVGRCWQHGGATEAGVREAAWIVGHAFARALDVTPWEGLLLAVRIAAGRVAFCEVKLSEAYSDHQLEPPQDSYGASGRVGENENGQPGQNLHYWVKQAELWHDKLARVSKLAIDAGVAERLVRQLELEAQLMLRATNITLEELGLNDEDRQRALGIMSRTLLALEAEEVGERVGEETS